MKRKIAVAIGVILFGLIIFRMFGPKVGYDGYCFTSHITKSTPPKQLKTAQDFFELGNYLYDMGNCQAAVNEYTKAILLSPTFSRAYNNRAYTNMRLHNYKEALSDLSTAISLDPKYVTALMNRGDIYNYYYNLSRDKALTDYRKVVALGKEKDRSGSVCGHIAMAETKNMVPLAILKMFSSTSCQ